MSRAGWFAIALAACCGSAHADEARAFELDAADGPLLACLEQLSQRSGVRIVDASSRVAASRCAATRDRLSVSAALQRWLGPLSLGWRQLDDGTIQIVDATRQRLDLAALTVEDAASPKVAQVLEPGAVLAPTVLAESATAVTRIEGDWLQRAPQLGVSRIGRYAPNMYGTGQGLAIRGIERDNDYFTSLTVSLDGIDLGTRLLDDDMVLLQDLQRIDLVRGARSFEAGSGSAAGEVRLITAAPAAEDEFHVGAAWGSAGAVQTDARWSGPLSNGGLSGSAVLAYRRTPDSVRFKYVPQANDDDRQTTNARLRLDYSPDSVPGLQAGLAALIVNADGNDRRVTPGDILPGREFPRSVFDRVSHARVVGVMHTQAQGLAGFVRYQSDDDTLIELRANDTVIRQDEPNLPHDGSGQRTREDRSRVGVLVKRQMGDTTAVAGLEHTQFVGYKATDWRQYVSSQLTRVTTDLRISGDSALVWLERQWSQAWKAGLGLRWLREGSGDVTSAPYNFDNAVRENMLLPLVTVQWQPVDGHALVLSRTAGYRSGGSIQVNGPTDYRQYAAERERTTELAWNAEWTPSTHSNLTLFRGEIDHRFTLNFTNSADGVASIAGAELEVVHAFSPRWQVRGGFGALEARNRRGAGGIYDIFLAGRRTGSAPPRTQFLGVRYGLEHGWFASLDAFHAAAAQSAPYNSRAQRRPAYSVLDSSVGYAAPAWQAALVATNLTDASYAERFVFESGNLPGGWRLGEPRRVELRFDYHW